MGKADEEDISVSCVCKRFEQYGLLCRHAFLVLRMFELDEIPEKYVLKRWRRDTVVNKANSSLFVKDSSNVNIDKANQLVREIMVATEYLSSRYFTNIEELTKVRDQLKILMEKAEGSKTGPILKKKDMMASLLGYDQPTTTNLRLPCGIRNKGRGSHKRIKSKKEMAASRAGKRRRACGVCGKLGHDIRTCTSLVGKEPGKEPVGN